MNGPNAPPTFKGRSLGIAVLVVAQYCIAIIHIVSGFTLLLGVFSPMGAQQTPLIYSVYTLAYGVLVLFFTYGIWTGKRWGWIGTVAVALFVIIADSLVLLNLPSISGIPKSATIAEVLYSLVVIIYLLQDHIRAKYRV